jgi:hypothetical protein
MTGDSQQDRKWWNVGDVMDELQRLISAGEITRYTPVETEGCDCVGPCGGISVDSYDHFYTNGRPPVKSLTRACFDRNDGAKLQQRTK